MTETTSPGRASILTDQARYLIATAARAPSVHNTQPWRFRVSESAIELYCDPRRKLQADPAGREMLISCGAALFGLRLGIRSLGYQPVVGLLPDPAQLRLLARVTLGAAAPMNAAEREMLKALPHRHTHRGAFSPSPLPAGLLAGLQHDAVAEGATLTLVEPGLPYERLADIANAVNRRLKMDPRAQAEAWRWSRSPASLARDGVPAHAFPATALPATTLPAMRRRQRKRLPQRDFDLGRGFGLQDADGPPPAVTAVLLTSGDTRADWLRAGQALHRLLAHAAARWVFASLHTQLLEITLIRALIRDRLALPGAPQMLLQLGVADTTHPTGRRPPDELIEP
jgi:nitroreductase